MTANDFIGGFSLSVQEILDLTKEDEITKWYKLLDEKRAKEHHEVILEDDEIKKVNESLSLSPSSLLSPIHSPTLSPFFSLSLSLYISLSLFPPPLCLSLSTQQTLGMLFS